MTLDRTLVAAIATALTLMTAALVLDSGAATGRVLLEVGDSRGVHTTDLPILAVWVLGMGACAALLRSRDR